MAPLVGAQAWDGSGVAAAPGNRASVEMCPEGHNLQESHAEIAKCECQGCSRWILPKEKVMWCAFCSVNYCSTCAPQLRNSSEESFWEDMLHHIGGALRDAERMKNHIASEIDIDFSRFRSAFNCQSPGSETISAERIVVEHAVEQAKATLSCSAPDTSDLRAQEHVYDHGCELASNPEDAILVAPTEHSSVVPAAEGGNVGTSAPAPTDLLGLAQEAPPLETKKGMDLLDMANEAPPLEIKHSGVDLLDLSTVLAAEQPVHETQLLGPVEASSCDDLLDLSEAPVAASDDHIVEQQIPDACPSTAKQLAGIPAEDGGNLAAPFGE